MVMSTLCPLLPSRVLATNSPNDHTAGIRGEGQSGSSWSKPEEKLLRQPGDSLPSWIVGILYIPAVASIAWSAIYI